MKKWLPMLIGVILLVSGCAPSFETQDKVVQKSKDNKETAIIPNYQLSDQYYRTIIPFKPSKSRGLTVSNLNTRYDIQEFETGLMRVATKDFSPDKYLFQEGQYLDTDTIRSWLNRKYTKSQLKERKLTEKENLGLNPVNSEKGSIQQQNEKNPIYLAHILEHDYLVKTDKDTVKLGGVVIGLALNSIHYYQKEQYGAVYEKKIDQGVVAKEGKNIAQEVMKRLRNMDGLKNVPITIALFEQNSKDSVVPGNFFAYTNVGNGSSAIEDWKSINEKYKLFPSPDPDKDPSFFKNFKQDVEKYFPNYNGVIGRALYDGDQLMKLTIDIPIQFYGEAEVIGFTQYITGIIIDSFPNYMSLEVSVTSVNGPKALLVKDPGEKEPTVHIYQ